jgi:dihydropyrimidinase
MSNLQEMLPVLYSEGVMKGRLTLERFAAVTSANSARLLGLYPRKGVIAAGSDADIVLWDPRERMTIRARNGYSRADFSVYEGWEITGVPRMTIRAGEILYSEGAVKADASLGRVLRRAANLEQCDDA